jgi:16S rRNA (cytidine1402-2'-O)-methyltransferase
MTQQGTLYIVGTPLGNLSDMTSRAIETLRSVDVVLCEDTRHTRKLLTHFAIDTDAESYHEHNEDEKAPHLIKRLENGESFALVSDAGMPVISDPGFRIVRLARDAGIRVEPIPGPFAGVIALAASGIAPIPFTFLGFTPHRQGERLDFYRKAAELGHTVIVYESPDRIRGSLEDIAAVFGEAEVCVARELTKMHEEVVTGTATALIEKAADMRGEITIVIGASRQQRTEVSPADIRAEFDRLRSSGMRRNDAIKAVAESFGLRKNDVYRLLISDAE